MHVCCVCLVQHASRQRNPFNLGTTLASLRYARVLARTVEHEEELSSVGRGRVRQAGQLAHCRITPCMKPFRLLIGAAQASSGWAGASKPREQRQNNATRNLLETWRPRALCPPTGS